MASLTETRGPNKRRLSRSTAYESVSPPSNSGSLYHRQPPAQPNEAFTSPHYTPIPSPIPSSSSLSPSIPPAQLSLATRTEPVSPLLWGMPLKYLSLITLAVQNASLTIIMHYSRVSVAPSQKYSAASAVLLVELIKGSISLSIAFSRIIDDTRLQDLDTTTSKYRKRPYSLSVASVNIPKPSLIPFFDRLSSFDSALFLRRLGILRRELLSPDCWKLSIPAILYVIQNNLQFVAASNLDVATFQVTYQMKILTTAAFSVLMLGKRLSMKKWLALLCLAVGVGIVQIQSGASSHTSAPAATTPIQLPTGSPLDDAERFGTANDTVVQIVESAAESAMNPFLGFMAVSAACMTSGLAGVYFEMVLKGSKADLWIRNVQLSLFSLIPAITPVLFNSGGIGGLLDNFGIWAWSTVFVQVAGGLVTAVVIKYSDNILKGFATSLSIVISFLTSVALFGFPITPSFVIGASTVLAATATYNSPDRPKEEANIGLANGKPASVVGLVTNGAAKVALAKAPILGHGLHGDKKKSSISSLRSMVASLVPSATSTARSQPPSTSQYPSHSANGSVTPPMNDGNGMKYSHTYPSMSSHHSVKSGYGNGGGFLSPTHAQPPSRISSAGDLSNPYNPDGHLPAHRSSSGSTSPTSSVANGYERIDGAKMSPYLPKSSSSTSSSPLLISRSASDFESLYDPAHGDEKGAGSQTGTSRSGWRMG